MSDNPEEPQPEEEQEGENAKTPAFQPQSVMMATKNLNNSSPAAPLWLVTFTDVMALMLTFFVLLYAMSETPEEAWIKVTRGVSTKTQQFDAKQFNAGSQDVINIDKINTSKALNLTYLKTLVEKLIKEKNVEGVIMIENDKRLIISLPSELLFKSGQAKIGVEGKKLLFALGGVLMRVKNRIEITGHTDPNPMSGKGLYKTNWQLSLARAASVAHMLKEVGYTRGTTIRGVASARFDEMAEDVPQEKRYELSRRVDLIVMHHDGYRYNAFGR